MCTLRLGVRPLRAAGFKMPAIFHSLGATNETFDKIKLFHKRFPTDILYSDFAFFSLYCDDS